MPTPLRASTPPPERPASSTPAGIQPLPVHLEWVPARLPTAAASTDSGSGKRVHTELLELARQLEEVEAQRSRLLQGHNRPPSPASSTVPLAPLTGSPVPRGPRPLDHKSASASVLPSWLHPVDVHVCECADEFPRATDLKLHQSTDCPLRTVQCPRPGCLAWFPARQRPHHDRIECRATRQTRQLLLDHEQAQQPVECGQCGASVPQRRLPDHQASQCPQRMVRCPLAAFGCPATFRFEQSEQHAASECVVAQRRAQVRAASAVVNEETVCDWCQQHVLKRRLLNHQEDECPQRERPCLNAECGCAEWVPVADMDVHIRTVCCVTVARDAMAARAREMNTRVPCPECRELVRRRQLARHGRLECVSRVVACRNAAHGCVARLRWRDRHLHEDFMALATRERSVLCFPVGGDAVVVVNSDRGPPSPSRVGLGPDPDPDPEQGQGMSLDLAPPWTAEFFVRLVDAQDELLDLHRQCLDHRETIAIQSQTLAHCQDRAQACKRKLKELKRARPDKNKDKDSKSTSQPPGSLALAAQELADDFDAADRGSVECQKKLALARGWLRLLLVEAHRILVEETEEDENEGESKARQLAQAVADQAQQQIAERVALQALDEDSRKQLSDLAHWRQAVAPTDSNQGSADRQRQRQEEEAAAEQRRLLQKRAELQQLLAALPPQEGEEAEKKPTSQPENDRLRRRYNRELAKLDAKLALVSDQMPPELLQRRGRHIIASSAQNAISLAGSGHGQITYYRSVVAKAPGKSKPKPKAQAQAQAGTSTTTGHEVNFQVRLTRTRWHHVVLCASQKELTLVLDGSVRGIQRGVFDLPFTWLGCHAGRGDSFQGFLQEARFWRSCRTLAQVQRHAARVLRVAASSSSSDLIAYFTMEEGGGDVVDDMALRLPRAPCVGTTWVLYNTPAIRRQLGPPPTPSYRAQTSCVVNQRLQLLAQRAHDRESEAQACRLGCGAPVALRLLEHHQRSECVLRLVGCRAEGCEATYRLCDRPRHEAQDCRRCRYRDVLVQRRWRGQQLRPCELHCGAMVASRALERHHKRECPRRLVQCPQEDCGETIVAETVEMHVARECRSEALATQRRMVANARRRQAREAREAARQSERLDCSANT